MVCLVDSSVQFRSTPRGDVAIMDTVEPSPWYSHDHRVFSGRCGCCSDETQRLEVHLNNVNQTPINTCQKAQILVLCFEIVTASEFFKY